MMKPYTLRAAAGANTFTATGVGLWTGLPGPNRSVSAKLSDTATPSATIEVHGTNDLSEIPSFNSLIDTLTLTGTLDSAKGIHVNSFAFYCAKCTAISGASASVAVTVGA